MITNFEHVNTLYELMTEHYFTESYWKIIMFQVTFLLAVIQEKYPNFRHNDLRPDNILIKRQNKKQHVYEMDDLQWTIHSNIQVMLHDFDYSVLHGKQDENIQVRHHDFLGRSYEHNPVYDLHNFLNYCFNYHEMDPKNNPKNFHSFRKLHAELFHPDIDGESARFVKHYCASTYPDTRDTLLQEIVANIDNIGNETDTEDSDSLGTIHDVLEECINAMEDHVDDEHILVLEDMAEDVEDAYDAYIRAKNKFNYKRYHKALKQFAAALIDENNSISFDYRPAGFPTPAEFLQNPIFDEFRVYSTGKQEEEEEEQ